MKYPKEHLRRANISMRTFRTLREKKTISNYVVTRICLLHLQLKKTETIGSLSKPRRRRQRERHQTKGLMSRTMAMHVRYKPLYISLPSSAKQQREMTKFCVLYGTWTTTANISYFHLELHATITHLARARF